MLIANPPCTDLAASGAQYWPQKKADGRQQASIDFFLAFAHCSIPLRAVENPVGIMSRVYRKPDQILQPWQFGDPYNKKTCLWLYGLPKLKPSNVVAPTHNWTDGSYRSGNRKKSSLPSLHRNEKMRSLSFPGVAEAMADQWGDYDL